MATAHDRVIDVVATAVAVATTNPNEAVRLSDEALGLPKLSGGLRSDLHRARGIALLQLARLADAQRAFASGIEAAHAAGDPSREAKCWLNLGITEASRGEPGLALQAYSEAIALAGSRSELTARACVNIGLLAEMLGDNELFLEFSRSALRADIADMVAATAHLNCGVALCRLGRLTEARQHLNRSLEQAQGERHVALRSDAQIAWAWLLAREGQGAAALQLLESTRRFALDTGLLGSVARADIVQAEVQVMMGRAQAAVDIGEPALPRVGAISQTLRAELCATLAGAYAQLGQWEQAYRRLIEAHPVRPGSLSLHESFLLVRRLIHAHGETRGGEASPAEPTPVTSVMAKRLSLSPIDVKLLHEVAAGHTNNEIGVALGISAYTVRNRLARVMRRLGVANRAAAASKALELGLVEHGGGRNG